MAYTKQACIGYDNIFARGTLTASSDQAGGEKENAADGFTFDYWKPVGDGPHTLTVTLPISEYIDYFAIACHNLADIGGSIKLQAWNGSEFQDFSDLIAAVKGPMLLRANASISNIYQLYVQGSNPIIGVVNAGKLMELPEGIYVGQKPGPLNQQTEILNSASEGGQFIGRSIIRSGASDSLKQDRVADDWVRSVWVPFIEQARLRPFFWAWRLDDCPGDVMYAWTANEGDVTQGQQSTHAISLSFTGIVG